MFKHGLRMKGRARIVGATLVVARAEKAARKAKKLAEQAAQAQKIAESKAVERTELAAKRVRSKDRK